jgi:hypothetical protein
MRLLCLTATLALIAAGAGLVAAEPKGSVPAAGDRAAIMIRGDVTGLYPGASKRVRLRLHNRSRRDLLVTRVHARPLDPDGRCSPRALLTSTRHLRRLVPVGSTVGVGYRITMRPDVANVCQGKRFPLRYRAWVQP